MTGYTVQAVLFLLTVTCVATQDWAPNVPSSCHNATECGYGSVCSNDGICVSDGSGRIPPIPMMSTAMAIVLACISGTCCLWCSINYGKCMARGRKADADRESDIIAVALALGCVCCLVLAVTVAVACSNAAMIISPPDVSVNASQNCSLLEDLVCEPYYCDVQNERCYDSCTDDGHCTSGMNCRDNECISEGRDIPGIKRPAVTPWLAALLGFVGAVCCCMLMAQLGPRLQRRPAGYALAGCVLGGLCVGLPLGLTNITIHVPASGDGAHCLGPRACSPYFCDMEVSQCYTSCISDDNCFDGYICSPLGQCELNRDSHVDTTISKGGLAALVISSFFVLCLLCFCGNVFCGFILMEGEDVRQSDFMQIYCCIGMLCGVIGAAAIGIPVAMAPRDMDITMHGNGSSCAAVNAMVCEPYLCDVHAEQCFQGCEDSHMCTEGSVCRHGVCVPDNVGEHRIPVWAAFEISLGVAFGMWLLCYLGCCRRRIQETAMPLERAFYMMICLWCICVAFVVVVVAVPLAVPAEKRVLQGTGEECTAGPYSSVCAPYLCDTQESKCTQTCDVDSDCRDGYYCMEDKCIALKASAPLDVYTSVVVIVAVFLSTFAVAVTILYLKFRTVRPEARLAGAQTPASILLGVECSAVCLAIAVAVLVLLPLAYDFQPVVSAHTGDGAPCFHVDDVACSPFSCDTLAGACFTSCTSSAECPAYFSCDDDTCVPEDHTGVTVVAVLLGIAFLALFAGVSIATTWKERKLVKVLDANREAARQETALLRQQMEERNSQLDAFKARIAKISRVVLDISPSIPPSHDPTLLTPGPDDEGFPGVDEGSDAEPYTYETCDVCMVEPSSVRMVGRSCRHGFCDGCAKDSLESMVENDRFPAECPGCRTEHVADTDARGASLIPAGIIENLHRRGVLSTDFARRFIRLQILKAFMPDAVMSCPACEVLVARPSIDEKRAAAAEDPTVYKAECPNCSTEFCSNCNVLWFPHEGSTCKEYAKKAAAADDETAMAILRTSKECPKCAMSITHYKGHACHHIAPGSGCPSCRYHFCIVCLEKYPCSLDGHGLFCDERCDCPPCPDCKPGKPCPHCPGTEQCPSCHPADDDGAAAAPPAGPAPNVVHVHNGAAMRAMPENHEALVEAFAELTGVEVGLARNFLILFNWDAELAALYFFEMRYQYENQNRAQ